MFRIEKLRELLLKIKVRPVMFLGESSLELLRVFLSGYILCKMETNDNVDYLYKFQQYVEHKYSREGTEHFTQIIRSITSSDEEAFYKFFDLFDEFFSEQSK